MPLAVTQEDTLVMQWWIYIGLRGMRAPPPRAQSFFIFMQFSGKIGQIIGWRPPHRSWRPPLSGKSWIRRCYVTVHGGLSVAKFDHQVNHQFMTQLL